MQRRCAHYALSYSLPVSLSCDVGCAYTSYSNITSALSYGVARARTDSLPVPLSHDIVCMHAGHSNMASAFITWRSAYTNHSCTSRLIITSLQCYLTSCCMAPSVHVHQVSLRKLFRTTCIMSSQLHDCRTLDLRSWVFLLSAVWVKMGLETIQLTPSMRQK